MVVVVAIVVPAAAAAAVLFKPFGALVKVIPFTFHNPLINYEPCIKTDVNEW
jgi:hypothetical protein